MSSNFVAKHTAIEPTVELPAKMSFAHVRSPNVYFGEDER